MTVLLKIKNAQLAARKARDTVATDVLTTLLGEVAIVGKTMATEILPMRKPSWSSRNS